MKISSKYVNVFKVWYLYLIIHKKFYSKGNIKLLNPLNSQFMLPKPELSVQLLIVFLQSDRSDYPI